MENKIIVALDFDSSSRALNFVDNLDPKLCRLKIGKELFTAAGPNLVEAMIKKEFDVFLDLKFHDIPNTVASAVQVAADLGVWMLNVHISGGSAMMQSAKDAILSHRDRKPILIGVTVLTSISNANIKKIGHTRSIKDLVRKQTVLAKSCGCHGIVCAGSDTKFIKKIFKKEIIVPGIRLKGDSAGDQKRISDPKEAFSNGATSIVVGRSVTKNNIRKNIERLIKELK